MSHCTLQYIWHWHEHVYCSAHIPLLCKRFYCLCALPHLWKCNAILMSQCEMMSISVIRYFFANKRSYCCCWDHIPLKDSFYLIPNAYSLTLSLKRSGNKCSLVGWTKMRWALLTLFSSALFFVLWRPTRSCFPKPPRRTTTTTPAPPPTPCAIVYPWVWYDWCKRHVLVTLIRSEGCVNIEFTQPYRLSTRFSLDVARGRADNLRRPKERCRRL